ncbi:MAG: hypothetical protein JXR83_09130 [Deltaproteobacteria bacterium]|nr:hypothetical protein [Deltaproteobacteria bacterium]
MPARVLLPLVALGCTPLEAREQRPRRDACQGRRLEVPAVGFNLAEEVEGAGFVSAAVHSTLRRVADLGSNGVALVVAARLPDLGSNALEHRLRPDRETLRRLVERARQLGLRTLIVPHIWVEGGAWRGDIVRAGASADAFFARYRDYVGPLADDAEAACADAFSLGVELKALTADPEQERRFASLIADLRGRFHGLLTYSANWDEAAQVRFWSQLDLISVNGFFPLATSARPTAAELAAGAVAMMGQLDRLAVRFDRPLLLIEAGYKATTDNARRPWEWPTGAALPVDEQAQRRAYCALADALRATPRVVGALFWLIPTGTDRAAAPPFEPAWGFSPLGRAAEAEVRALAAWAREQRRSGRAVAPRANEQIRRRR